MALHHFFVDNQVLEQEEDEVFPLRLSLEDMKHAHVLRLAEHERIAVVDATQDYFVCEVVSVEDSYLRVRIAQKENKTATGATVVLAQGIAKGEKMTDIFRQGTEIGVDAFIPFLADRSIVKASREKWESKVRRWQSVIKSAAMQSGRREMPEVSQPLPLDELCQFCSQATAVLIFWEEACSGTISQAIEKGLLYHVCPKEDARIVVVIGPEGGLTSQEVDALLESNRCASTISLGASILRTETAGVVGPALVLYELGALQ